MCMSVYFARSALSPTIAVVCSAARTSACPNGADVVLWPGSANEAIIAEVLSLGGGGLGHRAASFRCAEAQLLAADLPFVLRRCA